MAATLEINDALFNQIDRELAGLAMIHRAPAVKKGMRNAGDVVKQRVRERLPKPGYPGDKPELKPLRDATAVKVKEYFSGTIVTLVGYEWGAGSHGHNVEEGHAIVTGGTSPKRNAERKTARKSATPEGRGTGVIRGRVAGRYDIAIAAKATESAQSEAISAGIEEAIAQNKQGSTNG